MGSVCGSEFSPKFEKHLRQSRGATSHGQFFLSSAICYLQLKAPLRPVRAPVDLPDASEAPEASGRRKILWCDNRKTTARPARSS